MNGKDIWRKITGFTLLALPFALFGICSGAQAAVCWEGQDFGGADLVLSDGDTLDGTFTGIGILTISEGITIYGASERVSLSADEIIVNGALLGSSLSWVIDLVAQYGITLNGTLSGWTEIFIAGGTCHIGPEALMQVNTTGGSDSEDSGSGVTLTSGGGIGHSGYDGGTISIGGSIILNGSGDLTLRSEEGTIGSISFPPGSEIDFNDALDEIAHIQAVPVPSSVCLLIPGLAVISMAARGFQHDYNSEFRIREGHLT